jgi:serine/threonine-protein kinase
MLLDEARLAARLNHPNVVQCYEVGEGEGGYFIAMEYLDGQPLNRIGEELRKRGQRLDPWIAARIIADAAGGLAHAHELRDYNGMPLKIIHRDVSPHNIFVTYEGQAKLMDFGIAKAAVSSSETEAGVLKGKIAYMAPEQALGAAIDSRADLFAIGVVLWELVTGKQLFAGENAALTLHRLLHEAVPKPSSAAEGVDPGLEAIAMRALERDPAARYQSARELRDALEGWLSSVGRSVRAEEVGGLVASLFQETRAQVQGEIRKHMADLAQPTSSPRGMSLSSIDQIERAGGNIAAELVNLGGGPASQASGMSGMSRRTGSTSTQTAPQPARTRSRVIPLLLLLLATTGLTLFILFRRSASPPHPVAIAQVDETPLTEPGTAGLAPPPAVAPPPPAPAPSPLATNPGAATATATAPPAAAPARASHVPAPRAPSHAGRAPAPPPAPASDSPPGFLTFDTYPWTRVTEGGKVLGTTPLVHASLSPGAHTLTLDNGDQGVHQTYVVTIKSGESITRRLGLK